MTELTYRGVPYTRAKKTFQRKAQKMIYRGVAHDGLNHPTVTASASLLVYRCVAYTKLQSGKILLTPTKLSNSIQLAV